MVSIRANSGLNVGNCPQSQIRKSRERRVWEIIIGGSGSACGMQNGIKYYTVKF